ncbi:MAG: DUF3261 domain-containing protein [Legionellales bacterium]|nr:DUF3261 domain-containing protein [Legionellales bacterium]
MRVSRFLWLCAIAVSLNGCAIFTTQQTETPHVAVAKGQMINLPTPGQLNLNLSATQIVTASYVIKGQTQSYSSEVHLEMTPEKLLMVAVSGWGGQLFSLSYTGNTIKSSSLPMPNANMGIEHTLTDFIFTYATTDLLTSILAKTSIQLVVKPNQRLFLIDNKPIMQIDYQDFDPWKGKVIIHNYELNYAVIIQTIQTNRH